MLKVAKLTADGALDVGVDNSPSVINPELDPDRFYIRVIDPARRGQNPKVLVWTESAGDPAHSDKHVLYPTRNLIELQDDPDMSTALISKSMILMADATDDAHQRVGLSSDPAVADNALNDRTRIVALGGQVRVEYLGGKPEPTYSPDISVPVPKRTERDTVHVNVVILKRSSTLSPLIDADTVRQHLRRAQEIYAQVGVKLSWNEPIPIVDPPAGVDLLDGLTVTGYLPGDVGKIHPEARALIVGMGSPSIADIHIFYVTRVLDGTIAIPDDNISGIAIGSFYYRRDDAGRQNNEESLMYNAFISTEDWVKPETLAHELGHLLTNDGHYDGSNKYQNLMVFGRILDLASVRGAKRLSVGQEARILADPHTRNSP